MEEQDLDRPTLFVIPLIQYFIIFLFFVSLIFGRRDITSLTLLVLVMVVSTRVWARMSLRDLKCHSVVNIPRMFPGDKFTLCVDVKNEKLLPVLLQLDIPVSPIIHPHRGEKVLTKEGSLLWYQEARFQWELNARQRGVYKIGPVNIYTGDLLAFFFRRQSLPEIHHIVVYPRLIPLKAFSLPRHDFFGLPGAKGPVEDPIYILGTRDYQHGRSAKYIHWKASARLGRLQEKVHESTRQEKILLAVDVELFAKHGARREFEHALEATASLAVRLAGDGHAVGLITNGTIDGGYSPIVPVSRSPRQLADILEVLARVEMETRGAMTDIVDAGLDSTWGLSCVYFSYEKAGKAALAELYFRARKIPVHFIIARIDLSPENVHPPVRQGGMCSLDEICILEANCP
jgi:uncharacterized protein (DUF58 family)